MEISQMTLAKRALPHLPDERRSHE